MGAVLVLAACGGGESSSDVADAPAVTVVTVTALQSTTAPDTSTTASTSATAPTTTALPLALDMTNHPDGPAVVKTFERVVEGINTKNYQMAFDTRVAGFGGETLEQYSAGLQSSTLRNYRVVDIQNDGDSRLVRTQFDSLQLPEDAWNETDTCTSWDLTYTMVHDGAAWLISKASLNERFTC